MPARNDSRLRSFGPAAAGLPRAKSSEDVMAIACALEAEAARRYRACRGSVPKDLIRVIHLLDELAEGHERRAAALREELPKTAGGLNDPVSAALWAQLYADEDIALCDPWSLTSYRILAFAVDCADRTFALFTYLASAAGARQARDIAEKHASEALARAGMLRAARRKAFHREREETEFAGAPPARLIKTLNDFVAAALAIETALDRELSRIEEQTGSIAGCRALTRQQIEGLRRNTRDDGPLTPDLSTALARMPSAATAKDAGRLHSACGRAFAFYDAVASHPATEEVMLMAQGLSEVALRRLQELEN